MIKQSHRTSIYNIKADLSKSHGTYLYDINTNREILDLFGMYSSLPLGYNHPVFDEVEFINNTILHSRAKIANCEIDTPAAEKFIELFTNHSSMRWFSNFHFCCTGALAIEAAIKTAIEYSGWTASQKILTFKGSFHGINGYGGILASNDSPAGKRVRGFPHGLFGVPFGNPTEDNQELLLKSIEEEMPVAAVLVEPIQCTSGDRLLGIDFLQRLRWLCSRQDIPLIFDEIQTGFGGTGTMWYHEQVGVIPDIVVFGKKSQLSGIMVREDFDGIFGRPESLEVTWDGDVLDMIRCEAILRVYQKDDILGNVRERSNQLACGLKTLGLKSRNIGLLFALDFNGKAERDSFIHQMWIDQATTMIPTGNNMVRLRPNLAITRMEIDDIFSRMSQVSQVVM